MSGRTQSQFPDDTILETIMQCCRGSLTSSVRYGAGVSAGGGAVGKAPLAIDELAQAQPDLDTDASAAMSLGGSVGGGLPSGSVGIGLPSASLSVGGSGNAGADVSGGAGVGISGNAPSAKVDLGGAPSVDVGGKGGAGLNVDAPNVQVGKKGKGSLPRGMFKKKGGAGAKGDLSADASLPDADVSLDFGAKSKPRKRKRPGFFAKLGFGGDSSSSSDSSDDEGEGNIKLKGPKFGGGVSGGANMDVPQGGASAGLDVNAPGGNIDASLPSGDASLAVKPQIDASVKMGKPKKSKKGFDLDLDLDLEVVRRETFQVVMFL
eukprot:XP_011671108.1 PREDICTED: vesicle-associated protein-like isoform X2 [Strongylocentrotus purpuratus]